MSDKQKPALMKGKVYSERKHTVTFPVIAEVKYDEIRVHARLVGSEVEFLSYDGKPLHNLGMFEDAFRMAFDGTGLTEFDLGLEVNGNFNDSYRWARSSSGIPQEKHDKKTGKTAPALDVSMVRFYLFDLPTITTEPFSYRVQRRNKVAAAMSACLGMQVEVPESALCQSEADLDKYFEHVRSQGREGLMVKSAHHLYEPGKRIDGWLKMKPEAECDGVCIGFTEAVSIEGVPLGRAGSVHIRMEDGSEAHPSGIPHDLGKDIFEHFAEFYEGDWVQMEYMERDRQGGYRHPVFKRFRESK